ncbi:hypothetical protein [Polyangium jinanense]|uniref:Uncharacterized protein n=1 Tax=Polyangium jinanense TaxID=2829994 RepID=A0A9X3WWA7_9BACT|nr:hypothetical protein [Polyangium jinanense]MDC3953415.1 hypothetical protein [Polyangium jinanense]MDC3979464.1 hypothetical protein [Polyangium jinanense]
MIAFLPGSMRATHHYRSAGAEPRVVRVLDFDRLPDIVRERLVRGLADGGMPGPLLRVEEDAAGTIPGSRRFWLGAGITAAFVWLVLWFVQFGDLEGRFAVQPRAFMLGHALVVSVLALAVIVHVYFRRSKDEGAPFPSGRYLYSLDLVEVRGRILTVTSLATLRRVEGRAGGRREEVILVFGDGEAAPLRVFGDATELACEAQAAIEEATRLVLPDDQPAIERLDPFFELRVADDWASAESIAKDNGSRVPAFRWLVLASTAVGALLGPASWFARNHASDASMFGQVLEAAESASDAEFAWRQMLYGDVGLRPRSAFDDIAFERAKKRAVSLAEYLSMYPDGKHAAEADELLFGMVKQADNLATYGIYLGDARGRRHTDEVDDAMFAAAKRNNNLFAYRQYLEFLGKKHEHEIRTELLPRSEIVDARQKQDVAELHAIEGRYGNKWAEEVSEAIHHVYADRLDLLRLRKGSGGESARAIFHPLLTRLDTKGDPRVVLDVDFVLPNAFLDAETDLIHKHGNRYHPVGQVFWKSENDVEERVFNTIVSRARGTLGRAVQFQRATENAAPDVPRLVVSMTLVSGDEPFVSTEDKLVFNDIRIRLEMHAAIPGEGTTPSFVTTTGRSTAFFPNDYDSSSKRLQLVLGMPEKLLENAYPTLLRKASEELGELLAPVL